MEPQASDRVAALERATGLDEPAIGPDEPARRRFLKFLLGFSAVSTLAMVVAPVVGFDPASRHIICPCHDGHFNPANGSVISGPPPAPLAAVGVAVEGDQVFLVPGGA